MSVKRPATETPAQARRTVLKRLEFMNKRGDLTLLQIQAEYQQVRNKISAADRAHYKALLACFEKTRAAIIAQGQQVSEAIFEKATLNTLFR